MRTLDSYGILFQTIIILCVIAVNRDLIKNKSETLAELTVFELFFCLATGLNMHSIKIQSTSSTWDKTCTAGCPRQDKGQDFDSTTQTSTKSLEINLQPNKSTPI